MPTLGQIKAACRPLSKDELRDLNKHVVTLIKQYDELDVLQYRKGDTVEFDHKGETIRGTVIKPNKRSVSVRVGEYGKWTIHPSFLRKVS